MRQHSKRLGSCKRLYPRGDRQYGPAGLDGWHRSSGGRTQWQKARTVTSASAIGQRSLRLGPPREISCLRTLFLSASRTRMPGRSSMVSSSQCGTSENPVVRTGFVNAELAKLAVNTYVATKISFANVLAQICERLPDANVDVVTSILQVRSTHRPWLSDWRVKLWRTMLPRRCSCFCSLGRRTRCTERSRHSRRCGQGDRSSPRASRPKHNLAGEYTAICGVSFKLHTGVFDGSPAIWIARQLKEAGYRVVLYDQFTEQVRMKYGQDFEIAPTFEDCVRRSATVVLALPDREFARLGPAVLLSDGSRRTVIDCWRILDREKIEPLARYYAFGLGPRSEMGDETR